MNILRKESKMKNGLVFFKIDHETKKMSNFSSIKEEHDLVNRRPVFSTGNNGSSRLSAFTPRQTDTKSSVGEGMMNGFST